MKLAQHWSRSALALAFVLIAIVGCSTAVPDRDTDAFSAQAIAAASGVHFLPPVGESISLGNFDPDVDMVIKLFLRGTDTQVGPTFQTSDGTIQVTNDPLVEEQYKVNLDTSLIDADEGAEVRVEIRLASAVTESPVCNSDESALASVGCLAFFDLQLWPNQGQAKKFGASDDSGDVVIDLVDGRTLPIKVHVANGATDLVGYWSFDDCTNPGHDDSGNDHTGTLYGPACSAGTVGNALHFDGVDDRVVVANTAALTMTDGFTVTAFITPMGEGSGVGNPGTIASGSGIIVNKEGEYEIARFGAGDGHELRYAVQKAGGPTWLWQETNLSVTDNATVHVTWTFDAQAGTAVYVHDGSGSVVWSDPNFKFTIGDLHPLYNDLWIGARPLATQHFNGMIDELRLYKRALSADEVGALQAAYGLP